MVKNCSSSFFFKYMPQYFVSVIAMCESYFGTYFLLKISKDKMWVTVHPEVWEATHFLYNAFIK